MSNQQQKPKAKRRTSQENPLDQLPPHDLDSELGMIGTILHGGWKKHGFELKVEWFYDLRNKVIASAILDLIGTSKTVNEITVLKHLEKQGKQDEAGGMLHLQECLGRAATSEMFDYYQEPLESKAFLRKCQTFVTEVEAKTRENDEEGVRYELEKGFMEILSADGESKEVTVAEVACRVREDIVKRSKEGGGIKGIKTGFNQLDWLTGGLQPGTMSIIAARPSTGKTAMGINIWVNIGLNQKIPAVFFSAEMTADQVMERVYADLTTISLTNISRATLSETDQPKLEEAEAKVSDGTLFIDDSSRDISRICAKARYYVKAKGARFILIDYLQYLEASGGRMSRYEAVTLISTKLKALAKDLNVPVLVLAQVNRESEKDKRRPRIHDLRESGSIEQDADLIMMLHEGEDAVHTDPEIDVIGYLDKQRQGQRGKVVFRLQRRFCRFREKGEE